MGIEELMVSAKELDADLLVTTLKPFVRIEQETLKVRPQAGWRELSARGKVVAFLLTRKGMKASDLIEDELCPPVDIIRETDLPKGSVYPVLKELYESRPQIVERDDHSRYYIPNWAIHDAASILGAKGFGDDG